jgi:hypothetical protein
VKLALVHSFTIALATLGDTTDILSLQSENHVSNLPAETLPNGFVTTQLSSETLAQMGAQRGIWTMRDESGVLAAYACANPWKFYGDGPFAEAARALFPLNMEGRTVTAQNSFQYGPVCVAKPFRGHGVLERLVETISNHYACRFEFGITFIDTRNLRSLAAHERKLGFRRLTLLPFESATYHVLAFPTR